MYYGTYTFYERTNYDYIDTVYIQTQNNVPLFKVEDTVVTFLFLGSLGSLKVPNNCEIGTIIDSMYNFDNEKIYCKFNTRIDCTVYKQTGSLGEGDGILYKDCFHSRNYYSRSFGNGFGASKWQHYTYNTNYGFIGIDKGSDSPTGPDGNILSLIETNF
jgi:hypothetical protein